jgi:hypothetical protein
MNRGSLFVCPWSVTIENVILTFRIPENWAKGTHPGECQAFDTFCGI